MQEKKCPNCESTNILNGSLNASFGLVFIPDEEKGKVAQKSSFIICSACRECGAVFDLKLSDKPNKLTNQ